VSELAVHELRQPALGSTVGAPDKVRRPRRRVLRLRARIAAYEQELLRRQQTALALSSEARGLRVALASALDERAELQRALARLSAARARESVEAGKLAEAVLDQQAAVRDLERAVAVVLAGRL
jgi:hypothetical protein